MSDGNKDYCCKLIFLKKFKEIEKLKEKRIMVKKF